MGLEVEGLRQAVRRLTELGVEIDDLKDVFAQIAAKAAEEIEAATPRQSGALRASIRGNRAKGKAVVTAGKARVKYAAVQNYGWPKRNIRPRKFMQAADQHTDQWAQMLEEGIDRLIREKGLQ